MNSHLLSPFEQHATGIKIKKINAVHHHVNAIQKCFEVLFFDTSLKFTNVEIRIDVHGLFNHHIKLGTPEMSGFSTILTI